MINVYDGTLGTLFDFDKVKTTIQKYIINNPEPLNYEIIDSDEVKVVAILGKNEEEKNIPFFNHPIVFKNIKNKYVVASDFRLVCKANVPENTINIEDVLQDKYNGHLLIHRTILTRLFAEPNAKYRRFTISIDNNISQMLAGLIDTLLTQMTFDKTVGDPAKIATIIHYYTMDLDHISYNEAVNMLPLNILRKLKTGDLQYVMENMDNANENNELILPSRTITDLVNNIQAISKNSRLNNLDADMLISVLTRTFYSNNSKELSVAMIENKPTLYSIIYSVLTETINSKSIFRKVIEGRKNTTKPKDVVKVFQQLFKDNTHII